MSVFTILAAVVFSAWLLVTALNQSDRTRRLVRRVVAYDVLGLVPAWTFFAPNPGDTDLHVLYRDLDAGRNVGPWREHALDPPRRLWTLWLPNRRVSKAVSDLSFEATRADWDSESTDRGLQLHPSRVLSFPYLFLLNLVASEPGYSEATHRQFALARTRGPATVDDPAVILLSGFHEIDRP